MVAPYADSDDWIEYSQDTELPDDIDRYLRSANEMIRDACVADVFEVDSVGIAYDLDVQFAMRDAACHQIQAWLDAGIKPWLGVIGIEPYEAGSASIGSASVNTSAATGEAIDRGKRSLVKSLTRRAYKELRQANLCGSHVMLYG